MVAVVSQLGALANGKKFENFLIINDRQIYLGIFKNNLNDFLILFLFAYGIDVSTGDWGSLSKVFRIRLN